MFKKKKVQKYVMYLCSMMFLLVGCGGSASYDDSQSDALSEESVLETNSAQEDEKVVMKEVMFLNRLVDWQEKDMSESGGSGVWNILEFDEEYDDDTLFAYEVEWSNYNNKAAIVDVLQNQGFYFLKDYPDNRVIVAGTMKQFESVFLRDEQFEGYYLGANAIVRPDMEEIIGKFCENTVYSSSVYSDEKWFDEHFEELVPFLGTDKNRVRISVEVSVEPK